jgi:hypothetical protein
MKYLVHYIISAIHGNKLEQRRMEVYREVEEEDGRI